MSPAEPRPIPPVVRLTTAVVLLVGVLSSAWVLLRQPVAVESWLLVAGFAAAFFIGEVATVHIDFRDQSVGISASEYLLALGLFVLPPPMLLLARLAGGLPYRGVRGRGIKRVFNIGMLLASAGLATAIVGARAVPLDIEAPVSWSVALVALLAAAAFDAGALAAVIRATTGASAAASRRMIGMILAQTSVAGAVSIGVLLLWAVSPVAIVFVIVPAAVTVVAARVAVRERHEAERLQTLYELSKELSRAPELETVLAGAVREARVLLRCQEVELVLATGASPDLVLHVDERQVLRRLGTPTTTTTEDGAPLLDDDEVLLPISAGAEVYGHIAAIGRPQGREPFRDGDLAALRTLADNIGTAVDRGRLTQQLRTTAEATRFLEAHDVLTGLGNRRWFVDELHRMAGEHDGVVVALCNLRGFRRVNEQLGQAAGDVLLVEVADRLRDLLPEDAAIARLAGDEFAVALPGHDPMEVELAVGLPVTSQLRGQQVELTVAAGVAVWPDDLHDADTLLRAADLALVTARRSAQGGVVRYDAELEETIARRSRLASDLRGALTRGDVDVHFQPLVDATTGAVVAVEALARWTHPDLGPIPPLEFVTVAEGSGQVGALTRHVVQVAVDQAIAWEHDGVSVEVAVNVSALDLEGPDLLDDVRTALGTSGLPAHRLVLEVTETAMMTDRARGAAMLEELARLGVGLAIDDFGTGHSSLAYLQDLPVTEIKVDRVFVADILDNEQSELIVRTVVELAARRNLVVVAEGVEDQPVMDRLRALGVDRVQGWHTGRPAPAVQLDLVARPQDVDVV